MYIANALRITHYALRIYSYQKVVNGKNREQKMKNLLLIKYFM